MFFLAKHCFVSPGIIIRHRREGMSWMDICLKYGVTAEIFLVDFKRTPGPPYGKAWGQFKKKKKKDWKSIRLTDIDIINIVNLKFISAQYGYSPSEIVKMRGRGDSFVKIHNRLKRAGEHKSKLAGPPPNTKPNKPKAKGKRN